MQYVRPGFAYFMGAVLFLRVLHYSWVTDDAFITFRYVINFVSGDGPVFNIGERVQGFTHPLWFMLLSLGGFLDLNLYFFFDHSRPDFYSTYYRGFVLSE
jgi:arabinofuranosyltransferase